MDSSHAGATPTEDVSPEEEFAAHLPHVRRRWLARQEAGERRRREAWQAAR